MKKFRIFSIVLLIVCFALLLVACNSVKDNFSSKNYTENANPCFTTATRLDSYYGFTLASQNGQLVVFSKDSQKVVYNIEKGTVLGTYTDTTTEPIMNYEITLFSNETFGTEIDVPYYLVSQATQIGTNVQYEYTLFDSLGQYQGVYHSNNPVAANTLVENRKDFVIFYNNAYRVKDDGSMEKLTNRTDISRAIPNLDEQCGDYYYDKDGNTLEIYNKSIDLVYTYYFPDYAQNEIYMPLNNGNIFIQYTVEKLDDEKKYTFTDYNAANELKKYDLVQEVINIKKGKVKSVKNKYYVIDGSSKASDASVFNGLKKSIENVAMGYEIKDKKIVRTTDPKIFTMNNNGKVQKVINEDVQFIFFEAISKDRIVFFDVDWNASLYDYSGKKIGDMAHVQATTKKFIVGQNNIYDFNLNRIYSLEYSGYTYYGRMGENVILRDADGARYLYTGTSEVKKIAEAADSFTTTYGNTYKVGVYDSTNFTYTYKYYTCEGTEIAGISSTTAISQVAHSDKAMLVRYADTDNKPVYYVVK